MSIKYLDMFSGIGGFRSGLEAVGGFECIGYCEIDQYARRAYEAMYDTKGEMYFEDATKINPDDLPDIDLICGGFPCQAFSIAGRRNGFNDTRGTLFFEIARIAAVKKPALLFLENVPGLLSHDKGRTFATILNALDEIGYDVSWTVLNSANFGVPQARKRVYITGFLRGKCAGERHLFIFLLTGQLSKAVQPMSDIVPFYECSLDNARHCNEVDEWRASHKANIDCKKAIENAIADNYKDNHFNPDFASDIIEEFGFDRVNFILQYNLKQAQNDGRYSEKNKEWGKELYAPESNMRIDYLIGSHPILLDSFIDEVRSEWDKLNLWNSSHCISKTGLNPEGKILLKASLRNFWKVFAFY